MNEMNGTRKDGAKKHKKNDLNILYNKIKFIVHMLKSNQIDLQTTDNINNNNIFMFIPYVLRKKKLSTSRFSFGLVVVRRNSLYFQFYYSMVYLLLLRRADAKYHSIESKTINCGTRCLMSFSFFFIIISAFNLVFYSRYQS